LRNLGKKLQQPGWGAFGGSMGMASPISQIDKSDKKDPMDKNFYTTPRTRKLMLAGSTPVT